MVDAGDGVPLPGATVVLLGTEFGGYTDDRGRFEIEGVPRGKYDLLVSFIGYQSRMLHQVSAGRGEELEIRLEPAAIELPNLVVSAIRRTQTFAEAPVSMAVADARELAVHNQLALIGALSEVSGLNEVGNQISIRGSSGYSRGTGSRVLLLLDGTPLLTADLGDIKWDVIPIDQVERVEVIKGAGSALYGTGALGGVINVITRQPSERPETRLRMVSGLYDRPAYRSWRWTEDPMYLTGLDVSHSRTLGETGLLLSTGLQRGTGYHENGDFRRYRIFAKGVHRFSAATYWRTTATWSMDDHGVFIQWKDRTEPLAVPTIDRRANTVSWKGNLSSEFYHLHSRNLGYRLKTSYYRTGFDNSPEAGDLASDGHRLGTELQADYSGWERLDVTVGTAWTFDWVRSPEEFWGERSVQNLGLYGQSVYEPVTNAEVMVGLRYDWHRRSGGEGNDGSGPCPAFGRVEPSFEHQFSPQIGVSLQPRQGTALRASVGKGFRAPSVSEIYTQALVSGLRACPNPDLEAEHSWSCEVGIKQVVGGVMAVDAALFWNTYQGLIEGRADLSEGGAAPIVRFQNLSRARVRGLEIEQQMAFPYGLRGRLSYTYLDAVESLSLDEIAPPYCQQGVVPRGEAPLPYRADHLLNAGLFVEGGKMQGGVAFQYMSQFERVSGFFPECDRDHNPVYLVDAFVGLHLGRLQYNLRVDNLFQYHYVLTERKIRSPRQVSLAVFGTI